MQFTRNRQELRLYMSIPSCVVAFSPTVPQPTRVHPPELTLSSIRAVQFVESVLLSIICLDNEVNQRTFLIRIRLLPISGNGEPLDSRSRKNRLLPFFRVSFDDPHPWAIRSGKIYLHPRLVLQYFQECWLRIHSDLTQTLLGKRQLPVASTPHLHVLPKAMVFHVVEALQRVLPRQSYQRTPTPKSTQKPFIYWHFLTTDMVRHSLIWKDNDFLGKLQKSSPVETSGSS